ncbi:MAG: ferredoxin-type protein NapF [Methylococcales bacterium]|nr:ferredoxin-type protein NapF [Methylococcales bacterium]MBT7443588.1 ferredoxin-type protein NapF [Methylococcales bacterium]
MNRMQLIRGAENRIRPPWSLDEDNFIELCSRCGDCITQCSEHIIKLGAGGYPQVDFSQGECVFCRDCVKACDTGAIQQSAIKPWLWRAEVETSCLLAKQVTCQVCEEQCELQAISSKPQVGGRSLPVVNQDLCNGCGACIKPCPVGAIVMREQTI